MAHDILASLATLGDVAVGKTAFILQACNKGSGGTHASTIGVDIMPTVVSVAGKRVKLQCYDTAGQEQYRRSLTPVFVRNRDAYVLVYDVTDLQSLRSLRDNWVPMLANLVQPGATFLLVGNKLDLLHPAKPSTYAAAAAADASSTQASTTLVSLEEQELVEGIIHALQGELSAHVAEHVRLTSISGSGVQDAIQSVCRHIIRQKSHEADSHGEPSVDLRAIHSKRGGEHTGDSHENAGASSCCS